MKLIRDGRVSIRFTEVDALDVFDGLEMAD